MCSWCRPSAWPISCRDVCARPSSTVMGSRNSDCSPPIMPFELWLTLSTLSSDRNVTNEGSLRGALEEADVGLAGPVRHRLLQPVFFVLRESGSEAPDQAAAGPAPCVIRIDERHATSPPRRESRTPRLTSL